MAEKKHHCFNCGEEAGDYDELPNGKKIWICDSSECAKELRYQAQIAESEARSNAEEDGYSKYY